MPDPLTSEQLEQIHNDLFAGRKINAIKTYREATNVGLKEAKDAVEEMASELYQRSPERFTRDPNARGGCGTAVLMLIVVMAVAIAGIGTLWY
jgi:hypothetical protein